MITCLVSQLACAHNHASIARMLIVEGEACPHRRVPATGNVPLHLAAEKGHIETVKV
jgi:ankyrin repeat protein